MSNEHKVVRAKLIANPGSGAVTKDKALLEEVTRRLQELGMEIDVALAHPMAQAEPIARRAAKDGYKVVIAMGGDDTIESIIRGIAGSKTRLGIIPAGTANNIAAVLGIPLDPGQACELIASGPTRRLDLGALRTRKKKRFIFFEVVLVGIVTSLYPDLKKVPKGKLSKIKDAVVTLAKQPPKPKVSLTLDGDSKVEVDTMLVTITNMPIIGLHFLVAPEASMSDGLFDVAVYPDFSKAELLSYFGKVMNERQAEDGKIQRFRARKIKVKASPRLKVMSDGVMLGKGAVRIKLLPGALRVIAPEPGAGVELPPAQTAADLPAPLSPAEL